MRKPGGRGSRRPVWLSREQFGRGRADEVRQVKGARAHKGLLAIPKTLLDMHGSFRMTLSKEAA